MTALKKHEDLRKIIAGYGPMLVAYSGGVDSTLLAVVAREVLQEKTLCVLLDSPVVPRAEVLQAEKIARDCGLVLDIIEIPLMRRPKFMMNPEDRCYHCRKISAGFLKKLAAERGLACIADGISLSDTGGHRPGLWASTEEGIVHPFIEAGITKQDIRDIARERGLTVWDKPSAACLASRIPYGDAITSSKLQRIEEAEAYLAGLGIGQLRVRLHGNLARIEVHKEEREKILEQESAVVRRLKSLGFTYVTLDLEGYRSGSLDEVL